MQVKALTEIKKPIQTPVADGQGGFTLKSALLHLREGEIADVEETVAAHLKGLGYVSEDLAAPTLNERARAEG